MRILLESEMNLVAGGDEPTTVGEIVVTAAKDTWGSGTVWDNYGNNNGPPVQGTRPGDVAEDSFDSLNAMLESIMADAVTNVLQAEQRLAQQFNPGDIKPGHEYEVAWDSRGHIIHDWVMNDGSIWFDRDNNGAPDQHMRTTSSGSVYTDEGFGWHLVIPGNNN